MTDIKKGDRVKVTIEGEVTHRSHPNYGPAYIVVDGRHEVDLESDAAVVEKVEPPVEVFRPGDRLRRRTDDKWNLDYEVTLGTDGYLLHSGASVRYSKYSPSEREAFNSEKYEKVNLAEVPF